MNGTPHTNAGAWTALNFQRDIGEKEEGEGPTSELQRAF